MKKIISALFVLFLSVQAFGIISELDSETWPNLDISSVQTILTHTPDGSNDMLCQAYITLGSAGEPLDGSGGAFEFTMTIEGQTVQPSPQIAVFGTEIRASIWTAQFLVPAGEEVVITVESPNADTADVTAYLYDVSANPSLVMQRLDHLVAVAESDDVVDGSIMGKIASTDGDWSNFSETSDSLQSIRDAVALFDTGAEWLGLLSAVDTDATSATHDPNYVTLEAGKASNDAYNGMSIAVTDATDGNTETRRIEDWTSGLKATFDRALSFTPVQDDIVRIYAMPYNITAAISGGSANTYIVTETGDSGGTPIADVSVWVTADSAGARLVVSGVTDSNGEVVFFLDAGTTYYVWMAKSGYSFSDNGESWLAE